jgi:transcriptional regulator with PAS, ATPase and Fis domain
VNCAALQETLLESELFGHEKGAFTGATEQRPGLFEVAHRTTLFLDEIGELPPGLQAKLLRAVQFGEIRRVGGVASLKVDVRIVAATNRDLVEAVAAGTFREDLYYRLNVVSIRVPPLRERPEDIEPLWRALAQARGLGHDLQDAHFEVLRGYAWPGNVREMENLIERLTLHGPQPPDPSLLVAHLEPRTEASAGIRPLADLEREAIDRALRHFGGDRKAAARALGISVRTLYYRLSSYGREATR